MAFMIRVWLSWMRLVGFELGGAIAVIDFQQNLAAQKLWYYNKELFRRPVQKQRHQHEKIDLSI